MAKVFLDANETYIVSSNSDVFGGTGSEKLLINGTPTLTVASTIERVELAGNVSSYTFAISGNIVTVKSGTTTVASITVPDTTTGQTLAFADGSAALKISGLGAATLGGAAVPTTAAAVVPTTFVTTDKSTVTTSSPTTPTFSVAGSAASVSEGASATFTVSLSAAQSSATTVSYTLAGTGGAVLGTDTTTVANATLTFAAGEVSKTVTVPVTFDTNTETGEGVQLTLSAPSTGTVLAATPNATVTFTDPVAPTFTLTSNAVAGAANEEGTTITYTVTPSGVTDKAYTFTLSTIGDTVGGVASAAAAADFSPASQTVTFAAGTSTAQTVVQTIANDGSTEGLEGYKTSLLDSAFAVVSSKTGLITDPTSGAGSGTTYTLLTSLDNIPGTNGNDTIIGDFTATATLNAGDQINGGAGTDTLKMYGATTALVGTNMPITITNTEVIQFAGTPTAGAYDLSARTKAATGVTSVIFDDASAVAANNITTTTGQSLSLATGAAGAVSAGTTVWAASAVDTSLNLTLNGYQGGAGVTPIGLTVTGAAATTLNIASTGAVNKVGTTATSWFTGPTTVTSHVITGDKALTYILAAADAGALNSINASAATGSVNAGLAAGLTKAGFTFTGGSGDDSISFITDEFGTLTAGTQLVGGAGTDKIGLFDTAVTAAEAAKINAATGFEKIGLNAAITLDASSLPNFKTFDIDTTALTQSITNLSTGSTVNVGVAAAANFSATSVTVAGAVGVTDVTINLGGTTDTITHAIPTLVTTGLTNVKISSNGTAANSIGATALTMTDNSVFTLSGNADTTLATLTATATASKVDGSAATGKLTLTGNTTAFATGTPLGDVLIGGSAADTIKASVNGGSLTGNGGNDTFNVSVALGGINSTFQTTTITDFTKGDKITFGATAGAFTATKVDLSAAATVSAALDTLAAGANTDLKWGQFGGNTYIVDDAAAGATFAATDTMVKLTGTLDLSTSTLSGNTLTFA